MRPTFFLIHGGGFTWGGGFLVGNRDVVQSNVINNIPVGFPAAYTSDRNKSIFHYFESQRIQPLIAPAVSPLMMFFCSTTYTTRTGITTITTAAAIRP